MIQLNDDRYWLYDAVNPATNCLLHERLYPTRDQGITEMFFAELHEKHLVEDAIIASVGLLLGAGGVGISLSIEYKIPNLVHTIRILKGKS